jgi:8-oxo-dGTP pyrophosphatase MutT (NUDIX family)
VTGPSQGSSVLDLPVADGALLRRAARVMLVDSTGRLLLVRYAGRRGPTWIFVGGGVDAGESDEQAARREVAEETGCTAFELGPEVCRVRSVLPGWHGGPLDSRHRVFVGRCAPFGVDLSGLTEQERAQQVTARWWDAAELAASEERFEPAQIPALLAAYLAGGPPAEPVEISL